MPESTPLRSAHAPNPDAGLAASVLAEAQAAFARRRPWEDAWRDAYAHALPGRPGAADAGLLFDGTAADAAEQLAASLLAELTPPWMRWFGLAPGRGVADEARETAALEQVAGTLQAHFDRSNFAVEMHQAFLDLVIAGTACLSFEEAPAGESSAFRFAAVPLSELALEEGPSRRLDRTYRELRMPAAEIVARFPRAVLPPAFLREAADNAGAIEAPRHRVIEAVRPDGLAFAYAAILAPETDIAPPTLLAQGRFGRSPFITFRWLKAPGESYGRSPVLKALPDIRTANKDVELILKNDSIAVTGIWQSDDDGVLNPANIKLVPGAIIPKAVGSSGLTPLAAPGRFDVSQLVLDDLRGRIRRALFADRIAPNQPGRMTATEVLERSAETARLLGAAYGRLQAELLTPLIERGLAILHRRGEVPPVMIDGRDVALVYQSPIARAQARAEAQNALVWLDAAGKLGDAAAAAIDAPGAARWLARSLSVPTALLRPDPPTA